MASIFTHLYIGKRFIEQDKRRKPSPQFYLGCILPDSVNAHGFAERDARWAAHLRSADIQEWYENNRRFYRQHTGTVDENLLLGFVLHNVTDAALDEYLLRKPQHGIYKNSTPPLDAWWHDEVAPALQQAVPDTLNGLSLDNVKLGIEYVLYEEQPLIPEGSGLEEYIPMVETLSSTVCRIVNEFAL